MTDIDEDSKSKKGSKKPARERQTLWDKAVVRDQKDIPESVLGAFYTSLEMVRLGMQPGLKFERLEVAGKGVIELKINKSPGPGYRCMYAVAENGDVVVLHITKKTTKGRDGQLIDTTSQRYKRLMAVK